MDGYRTDIIQVYKGSVWTTNRMTKEERREAREREKEERARRKEERRLEKEERRLQKEEQKRERAIAKEMEETRRQRENSPVRDEKTLNAIGEATKEDMCSCVRVLSEYIKETVKLVLCARSGDCDTRFSEMFCELGDITVRLFYDAFNFVKFLLRTVSCFVSQSTGRKA